MEAVFLKVLNMGLTASWLILAVVIFRIFLKKAPKWISCLLWAMVAFKLVCPFSVESALSLIPSDEPLPEVIITENTFQVNTGIGLVDTPVNTYLGDHYDEGVPVPADNGNYIMHMAGIFWVAGVILLLLYGFFSYLRLYRMICASVRWKENIFLCDSIDTPFILGIVKPRIYLPSDMDKAQAEYVIAHERAHLGRRDHWWKPLGFLILAIYWFHPLCWISYILLCKDIELACDERVIRELGQDSKKPYAEALLSCSVKQSMVTACPLAFGEVGVKERVKNVLYYKKPAFWIIVAAAVCCVVTAVCFLTSPNDGDAAEDQEELSEEEQAVPAEVLERAEQYVEEAYQAVLGSASDYDYANWRIEHLERCYTYEELEGKTYEIYQLNFQFQSVSPKKVILTGGMSITEDEGLSWVVPDYPDSRYLVFEKAEEEQKFIVVMFENDCFPGDEIFTEDMLAFIREYEDSQSADARDSQTAETDGTDSDKEAALTEMLTRWRRAYCDRDAETIVDMIASELIDDMVEGSEGNYSFGYSSPWPRDYETDSYLYDYNEKQAEIYYFAETSDPHVTCWKEVLDYTWENDGYVITGSETKTYNEISTGAEFEEAYHGYLDGTMMDYTRNGLGEILNKNALLSSSMAYRDLFSPESAAVLLLNLSDDPGDVELSLHEPEGEGLIGLDITFLQDQTTCTISMFRPYGENGIWVPVDYRVDVIARFMNVPWDQVKNIRFTDGVYDSDSILCIGEIPERDIKVYGYNDEEVGFQGVAVEIGEDVNYFDWFYTSPQTILPDLYWDAESRQLQISCHVYTGTGASADELHVLQQYDTGTLSENNFALNDYGRLLEERISYSFDKETRELMLTDTKTREKLAEAVIPEEDGENVTGLELGMISDFELGEKIYLRVEPGCYMDDFFGIAEYEDIPELRFEVVIGQDEYGNIVFELGEGL